jgi:hypothetical protein
LVNISLIPFLLSKQPSSKSTSRISAYDGNPNFAIVLGALIATAVVVVGGLYTVWVAVGGFYTVCMITGGLYTTGVET